MLTAAAVLAAVVLAVVVWRVTTQASAFVEPESVGALARRIDAVVPGALREHHVPGAQVAVVRDGVVRWSGAYGVADAASGRRVRPDTAFQAASVTKTIAALTALRLGADLDAPVRAWRARPGAFDASGVTLRRLLSHTAGTDVPGYLGHPEGQPLPSTAAAAAHVRLVRAPGSAYAYSGGGYTVAQLELERASGRPFADLVRETTFTPLGMTHSDFACTTAPTAPPNAARGHDGTGAPMPRLRYAELAAAGACTTASDLGRLLAAVMRTPRMAIPQPATDGGYGLGLHLATLGDGTREVWHDGANRGWQSRIAGFPDRGWGIAVVTNGDAGGRVIDDVLKLLAR